MHSKEVESVLLGDADHPLSEIAMRCPRAFDRAGVMVNHSFMPSFCSDASSWVEQ